ncbi:MAG: hypothetical protein COA74_14090 [Gammaproteobacteria bacterium]|nr:MAG: hypothetical protein COA74_14090 [Gammaproteobacteria bacterium]
MLNRLLKAYHSTDQSTAEAEDIRQKLQSIYFKLNTYHKHLKEDSKLKFKKLDTSKTDLDSNVTGQTTFFLGGYAIRYEFNDIKSIQLYRRGKVDSLQFAELLAISFFKQVEYIADELFVKSDLYQLEILINHVVKNRAQTILV